MFYAQGTPKKYFALITPSPLQVGKNARLCARGRKRFTYGPFCKVNIHQSNIKVGYLSIDTTVNKTSKVQRTRTIKGRCKQLVLLKLSQRQTKILENTL